MLVVGRSHLPTPVRSFCARAPRSDLPRHGGLFPDHAGQGAWLAVLCTLDALQCQLQLQLLAVCPIRWALPASQRSAICSAWLWGRLWLRATSVLSTPANGYSLPRVPCRAACAARRAPARCRTARSSRHPCGGASGDRRPSRKPLDYRCRHVASPRRGAGVARSTRACARPVRLGCRRATGRISASLSLRCRR